MTFETNLHCIFKSNLHCIYYSANVKMLKFERMIYGFIKLRYDSFLTQPKNLHLKDWIPFSFEAFHLDYFQ